MSDSEKKPLQIKIAGFTLGKKFFILVGIIAIFIAGSMLKDKMEYNRRVKEAQAELEASKNQQQTVEEPEEYDYHAEMQKTLSESYGIAPEGFEWGYTGELIPLGNDKDSTAEDVAWIFLRNLAILNFETAQRYSDSSHIIDSYNGYYNDYGLNDYYSNFLRKQFKKSIQSIEVTGVTDIAVFADGTKNITLTVDILDLTNKDFWRADTDDLHKQLRVYREVEGDDVKLEQYVYDYIYEKYEDGSVGKRSVTVELIVSKVVNGGWLVSGDSELNAMLMYENGVDVAAYILEDFNQWYQDTTLKEQLEEINKMTGQNKKKTGKKGKK